MFVLGIDAGGRRPGEQKSTRRAQEYPAHTGTSPHAPHISTYGDAFFFGCRNFFFRQRLFVFSVDGGLLTSPRCTFSILALATPFFSLVFLYPAGGGHRRRLCPAVNSAVVESRAVFWLVGARRRHADGCQLGAAHPGRWGPTTTEYRLPSVPRCTGADWGGAFFI